jgi:hypothetical protein
LNARKTSPKIQKNLQKRRNNKIPQWYAINVTKRAILLPIVQETLTINLNPKMSDTMASSVTFVARRVI